MVETPLVTSKRLELLEVRCLVSEINVQQRCLASDLFSGVTKYLSSISILLQ